MHACARADTDQHWEIDCEGKSVDVVDLVEMMIVDGWDAIKEKHIQEKSMPKPMRIMDLRDCDGEPLDLSKPDLRKNDMIAGYESDPPTFQIRSIQELQAWHAAGRELPPGSHDAGSMKPHNHRNLKYSDDPLGLVADKLGRAIADERRDSDGHKKLEPVFVHVYSLGHSSVLKQVDKGLEYIGCGAFHAAVECYGVEWSYGYNDEEESGVFPGPPKLCPMHEYKESHYIGDTTLTSDEFELWLQFLRREDYKQEDPLDPNFPKRVPMRGESPAEFFGSEKHPTYDCLRPVTKEADVGEIYDYHDFSRMWSEYETEDGEKVICRLGWWGTEYELLKNNCCFFSDHLLKILVGKPLPSWIFSLAKVADTLSHSAVFVVDEIFDGVHAVERAACRGWRCCWSTKGGTSATVGQPSAKK